MGQEQTTPYKLISAFIGTPVSSIRLSPYDCSFDQWKLSECYQGCAASSNQNKLFTQICMNTNTGEEHINNQ